MNIRSGVLRLVLFLASALPVSGIAQTETEFGYPRAGHTRLSPDERQQMRQQMREHWQQMPPEQQRDYRQQRQERWQQYTPEERERWRDERRRRNDDRRDRNRW
ncbi:MAG TPA: hypothetical protein PLW86_15970 [Rhodocyclaceae bacterium]|nr:hypothetical protein [Rhodocyclaceae bacterium]